VEKKNGGRRLLLIPSVLDRVAQSAVAIWLAARWDHDFDPSSFAYRPGLGVHDALRALAALRDRGNDWVLDADLHSFFDSLDHSILLEKLETWLGAQSPMLDWLRNWIRASVWDGMRIARLTRGVPQGSPLSPILANYYLDDFDRALRKAKIHFVRYADDFVIFARTPFALREAREFVEATLAPLRLRLNENKTRVTRFSAGFRFLGAEAEGERLLLPFEKKKEAKKPVFVAPKIPVVILRAWSAGHFQESDFTWTPHPNPEPVSGPAPNPLLRKLAGSPTLDALRSGAGNPACRRLSGGEDSP
jgi:group II intron reverse transcriptase/maturase